MDLSLVKKLVKLLSESDVDEIEIEEEGKKVRIVKHTHRGGPPPAWPNELPRPGVPPPGIAVSVDSGSGLAVASASPQPATPPPANVTEIRSPIVGTFYRAPAPDAAPFVQVGSDIRPGTVLCIVEAMKLMNEIESDVTGKISRVMVENGQPVEYDQVLFLVEKT